MSTCLPKSSISLSNTPFMNFSDGCTAVLTLPLNVGMLSVPDRTDTSSGTVSLLLATGALSVMGVSVGQATPRMLGRALTSREGAVL